MSELGSLVLKRGSRVTLREASKGWGARAWAIKVEGYVPEITQIS